MIHVVFFVAMGVLTLTIFRRVLREREVYHYCFVRGRHFGSLRPLWRTDLESKTPVHRVDEKDYPSVA